VFVFYSDHYTVDLPPGHRFPIIKYALTRQMLLQEGVLSPDELHPAQPASREQITLAHTAEYLDALLSGQIDPRIMRQIGLPWSEALVRRSLASVGGSLAAAEQALRNGIAGNLGGGTHHALAGEGMGFCVFNDLAVVALNLLTNRRVERVAIVDLDVHQGNGTAAILGSLPQVFLLSLHGDKNYPFRKVPSTLDIGLPDNTDDAEYLAALERGLEAVFAFRPQIVLYQAGVDVLKEDRLGRLNLTMAGVKERDRLVLSECYRRSIPVVLVMGGGYAVPIERTAQAHVQTYCVAKEIYRL
jgi:acetoin utilization deacetylase AcuC-like enzyme